MSDALAAQMNGMPLGDTITNETIVGPNTPNSGKFLIGQGKLDIQTDASVGNTLGKLQSPLPDGTMGKLNAILDALAPTKDNAPLVGVVGGEGHFDANTAGFLEAAAGVKDSAGYKFAVLFNQVPQNIQNTLNTATAYINKTLAANTVGSQGNDLLLSQEKISITVGGKEHSPLVIGFIGGDMAVNAGMSGNVDVPTVIQWKADSTLNTSISRKGNIEGNFYSGNVLIGTGASSGLSIGGITVTKKTDSTSSLVSLVKDLTLTTAGNSIVTLNGDVNYNVNDSANLVAWANAGGAFAVGGSSTAIVNGNSTLSINTKKPQADLLDGIVGLAAVGGTAVSTLGGNATSTVDGNTVLNVINAVT